MRRKVLDSLERRLTMLEMRRAVNELGYIFVKDAWSPEARKAAAETRKRSNPAGPIKNHPPAQAKRDREALQAGKEKLRQKAAQKEGEALAAKRGGHADLQREGHERSGLYGVRKRTFFPGHTGQSTEGSDAKRKQ